MKNTSNEARKWAIKHGWSVDQITLEIGDEKHEGWLWVGPQNQHMWSIGLWDAVPTVPPALILEWERHSEKIMKKEAQELSTSSRKFSIKITKGDVKSFFSFGKGTNDKTQKIR